ncbi:MAG: hypothetical protein PHV51_00920 [Methanosarcinaceae archaeon]|nr:hypothetical protein [Methanosarcinaceae archaeon]MDD4496708.1 hypothetical protein [Methanosarcinaceae archaeon]
MFQKRSILRILSFLLIAITCTIPLAEPVFAEEAGILRSFSTENPGPGEEFDVILVVSGLEAAGIVENIPEGFAYVETLYPGEAQVNASGQNLVFSVLDDEKIVYRIKAPEEGSGTFEGKWKDFLNGAEGTIQTSGVKVDPGASAAEAGPDSAEPRSSGEGPNPETSPLGIEILLMGGLAAAAAEKKRRK